MVLRETGKTTVFDSIRTLVGLELQLDFRHETNLYLEIGEDHIRDL